MKKLILIRHAKSSWKDNSLQDIDRPLNKRGKRDAPEMGKRLFGQNTKIDLLVCSPAKRTKHTAKEIATKIIYAKKHIVEVDSLYHASVDELIKFISHTNNSINTLALVLHNPGITELANILQDENIIDNVPTCGIVTIEFKVEFWKSLKDSLKNEKGSLLYFDYPKLIQR